jgi:serine/threonine-protein kinase
LSHVFISYATEDLQLAEKVCRYLEERDVKCWMAPRDIPAGKDYAEAIVDGIRDARGLIVLLSAASNESPDVYREIRTAGQRNLPLVPIMIEQVEPAERIQYFIGAHQWLSVAEREESDWLQSLASAVRTETTEVPRVGTTIGDRLDLESVIGEGGMGIVYLAEHRYLRQKVAVKLMKGALLENENVRRRFLDEAARAKALRHENVVPILDAGVAEGLPYLVMDYIEGHDLQDQLAGGPIDPPEALRILQPVARALDFAHERGIIHRDVKPGNILISKDGHVYLTDFGIARETMERSAMTRAGAFVGTLEYAAPEQIRGEEVDERTDIYALGCVLYHCLAGNPPFTANTDFELMKAHTELPRPELSQARKDLPKELDSVVATAMATSREDRYESCEALLAKARAALEGGAQTRVPGADDTGTLRPARRRKKEEARAEPPEDGAVTPAAPPATPPPPEPPPAEPPPQADGAGEPPPPPREPEVAPKPAWKRRNVLVAGGGLVAAIAIIVGVVAGTGGGDGVEPSANPPPPTEPSGGGGVLPPSEDAETLPPLTDPLVTDPLVTDSSLTDPLVTDSVLTDGFLTDGFLTDGFLTDGFLTDGTSTGVVEEPFPNVVESDLLSYASTAEFCNRFFSANPVSGAIVCSTQEGITTWHEKWIDASEMFGTYGSFVSGAGAVRGGTDCSQLPAENFWAGLSNPNVGLGGVLCYEGEDGSLWLIWTHDSRSILSYATYGVMTSLYDWWVAQYRNRF